MAKSRRVWATRTTAIVPYQAFQVKDGYIVVAVGNNEQFARFCMMIGKPEWALDARFAKNKNRVLNRNTLVPMIEEALKSETSAAWVEKMHAADIPGGPVNRIDEVLRCRRSSTVKWKFPWSISRIPYL